jgi:hypothetical protein
MSRARINAYINGVAQIPDVLQDYDGWLTLAPVQIDGKIFGRTYIRAEYTVRLCKFTSNWCVN